MSRGQLLVGNVAKSQRMGGCDDHFSVQEAIPTMATWNSGAPAWSWEATGIMRLPCQMSPFFLNYCFFSSSALHVIGLADGLCQVAKTFEVVQSLVFVPFCGDLNGLSTDVWWLLDLCVGCAYSVRPADSLFIALQDEADYADFFLCFFWIAWAVCQPRPSWTQRKWRQFQGQESDACGQFMDFPRKSQLWSFWTRFAWLVRRERRWWNTQASQTHRKA